MTAIRRCIASIASRALEQRARRISKPGLQDSPKGRLFSRLADGFVAGHSQRNVHRARARRRSNRAPAPRSRHCRPGRDRHPLRAAQTHGRQPAILQIHPAQRREEAQQDGHLHAEAALRRQWLGHAHAHLTLERRQTAIRRQRLRRVERPGVVSSSRAF